MTNDTTATGRDAVIEAERRFFDRKAREEEENAHEAAQIRKVAERALELMGLSGALGGRTVLECACGTGRMTVVLAEQAARVEAFDLSPESVRVTREKAERLGLKNLEARVARMEDLPYATGTFDVVIGLFILHHLTDPTLGVREVSRVLKPGGRAFFFETSGRNRFLMFCRRHLAGRLGIPRLCTPDEHPLTDADFLNIATVFDGTTEVSQPHFRFFGKLHFQLTRRFRPGPLLARTEACCEALDNLLCRCFPPLRRYSYLVMLQMTKTGIP